MPSTIGTVKWFDVKEGRGVITPDDGGKEVSVEAKAVAPGVTLKPGLKVEFEIMISPEGRVASRVLVAPR